MPPLVGKGTLSVAFVRPSVAYIANNWRTRRPSVPKFGMEVPHLWCDSHTSFKGQGNTGSIVTHIVRHIFRMARLRTSNFKHDNPHQPQAPWPPKSKVKVARSRDQFEPSWPNAVVCRVARWLSGRASDLRSKSRGFEARPRRCCATTLGKLFTRYCLCHQAV